METIGNNLYLTKLFGEMISEFYYSIQNKLGTLGSILVSVILIFLFSITKIFI